MIITGQKDSMELVSIVERDATSRVNAKNGKID